MNAQTDWKEVAERSGADIRWVRELNKGKYNIKRYIKL
jgi:hypothetical protein